MESVSHVKYKKKTTTEEMRRTNDNIIDLKNIDTIHQYRYHENPSCMSIDGVREKSNMKTDTSHILDN